MVKKASYLCALIVFGVALAIYSRTLAPTVTPVDSGELVTAARFLGVAHSPGFPLYLFSLVPMRLSDYADSVEWGCRL